MAEALKDSGYAFIGAIPSSWKIARLNTVADLFGRIGWQGLTSDEYTDEGAWLVTGTDFDNGSIDWDSCVRVSEARWKEAYQIQLENGDLLITKDGTVGKLAIVDNLPGHASLNSGLMRIVPLDDDYNVKYLYYVLQTDIFREWFKDINAGASTIQHLFQGDFKHFLFPLPPKKEQEEIVHILDSEVNKLDSIQDNLEKQINVLERYKKSVIHEAVTKGLRSNVQMKDSRIDWIGEIPAHWEAKRLKYFADFWNGLTYEPEDVSEDGVAVMRSGNIQNGKLDFADTVYVDMKVPDRAMLRIGDTLVCSRNGSRRLIGKNAYIEQDGLAFGAFMMAARPSCNSKYFYYLLNSNMFPFYLPTYLTSTVNQLTNANFGNMYAPLPPNNEQEEIAEYLDERTKKVDKVLAIKFKQVEIVKKRKKSLVYEYVTGKRRVEG